MFENKIPWEKDIYVNLLINKVKEENDKIEMEKSSTRARNKRR